MSPVCTAFNKPSGVFLDWRLDDEDGSQEPKPAEGGVVVEIDFLPEGGMDLA
jgi:hypothetical protein